VEPSREYDLAADRLHAAMGAEAPRSSWATIDVAALLAGTSPDTRPSLLRRGDGRCLLYPTKVHSLSGEPEAGKGWVAMHACAERMAAGKRVLYLDFEDSAATALERLRALGVPDEQIVGLFAYVAPDEPLPSGALDALLDPAPTLVVIDAVTEAMVLQGLSPLDNTEVAEWQTLLCKPCARVGAAVLVLDHVTKDREGRGRWAIGAQHKLAGVDVAYTVSVSEPLGRGRTGRLHLAVAKDRPGHVRGFAADGRRAAEVVVRSDGQRVELLLGTADDDGDGFRPTTLMERVSRALEAQSPLTGDDVRTATGGRGKYVDQARNLLVAEGYARAETEGRKRLYHSVIPYRESDGRRPEEMSSSHSSQLVPDELVHSSRRPYSGTGRTDGVGTDGTSSSRPGEWSSGGAYDGADDPQSGPSVLPDQFDDATGGGEEPSS